MRQGQQGRLSFFFLARRVMADELRDALIPRGKYANIMYRSVSRG